MAYPIVTGAVLLEANGAALNNAGQDTGARVDNAIVVKQIRIGRLRYPYVSGQAWRRWWREVLYTDFGWTPSEVIREPKSAYTQGDPITYEEDDLFGYMLARPSAKGSKKGRRSSTEEDEGEETRSDGKGTYRRISPLKNSLLISVLPNTITSDFGHFSRNLPAGADILPFESEHYTTFLQGVFTISLSDVGRFEVGEMRDLPESIQETHRADLLPMGGNRFQLPLQKRVERVQHVLRALTRLRGGAHLARNLSDVAPVVVLVGFLDGGNAPLQRLFEADENNERVRLNIERLRSVLTDYENRLLRPQSGGKALYFGCRPGILANEQEVLDAFKNNKNNKNNNNNQLFLDNIEVAETPQKALERAAEQVQSIFEQFVEGSGGGGGC